MTNRYIYTCPFCGLGSWTMMPLEEVYEPTELDLFLQPELEYIGHEILHCECGAELSWFHLNRLEKTGEEYRTLDPYFPTL